MLADMVPSLSRSMLKRLILEGFLSEGDDGRTVIDPSYHVKQGEHFRLEVPPPSDPVPAGEDIPLSVVFEDDHLIVIDKPAGLVVHPAPGNPDGTLVNALISHCGDSLAGIGGVRRPGIVHRLDKDTSGLMVAAKTSPVHEALVIQFAERTIERSYAAFVWGEIRPPAGEISGNIGRSNRDRKKMAVVRTGGRAALTRYRTLETFGGGAGLLECRLATGRTHQIRVHLSHRGHPIIGDPVYGGGATRARQSSLPPEALAVVAGLQRQALHARKLGFRHPGTGEDLLFESDLPDDLGLLGEVLHRSGNSR